MAETTEPEKEKEPDYSKFLEGMKNENQDYQASHEEVTMKQQNKVNPHLEVPKVPEKKEEAPAAENKEEKEEKDFFTWDAKNKTEPEKKEGEPVKEQPVGEKKEEPVKQPETNTVTFDYQNSAKELGLGETVKDQDTYNNRIKDLLQKEKENEQLRSTVKGSGTSEGIQKLETAIKLSDEDLVKAELRMQKWNEEQITDYLKDLNERNSVNLEAKRIRNTLTNAISAEREKLLHAAKDGDATQPSPEALQKVKEFEDLTYNTETMFGMKIGSSPEETKERQKFMVEYVRTGEFADEVFGTPQSLLETAYLVRNKEKIFKVLEGMGTQKGRMEVLKEIHDPETAGSQNVITPKNPGEIDYAAFHKGLMQ